MTKAKKRTAKVHRETGWGIVGNCGLYADHTMLRRQAIKKHAEIMRMPDDDRTTKELWRECRRNGDRCVKLNITWSEPATKAKKRSAR